MYIKRKGELRRYEKRSQAGDSAEIPRQGGAT
jgi:hypothetical protein